MDHAEAVTVLQCLGDPDSDLDGVDDGHRPFQKQHPERRSQDERHHEKYRIAVLREVVKWNDGRMVHASDDSGFAPEAFFGLGAQHCRRKQFDRDVALENGVPRKVNDPHAAPPDFANDFVAVGEKRADHCSLASFAIRPNVSTRI